MTIGNLLAIAFKPNSRAPMEALAEAVITTEAGIEGDARGTVRHRQITILAQHAWAEACAEAGADLPWTARRANLLVEGIELANTTGRVLSIGPVRLEITGETLPCARMDEAHPGLRRALEPGWRAGVTAKVLSAGTVRPGDVVAWPPTDAA